CAIIAVFYLLVWKMEPFSSRFAKNVEKMKTRLSKDYIPPWVISVLFMIGFFLIVILFLTTIILLPGITVTTFLSESGLEALGHLVLLIALLAVSQYFIIRYFHGISSRLMAERLFEYKETALRDLSHGRRKNRRPFPFRQKTRMRPQPCSWSPRFTRSGGSHYSGPSRCISWTLTSP